jgi:hypothetical protein
MHEWNSGFHSTTTHIILLLHRHIPPIICSAAFGWQLASRGSDSSHQQVMVKAQSLRIIVVTFAVAGSHAWTNAAVPGTRRFPYSGLAYDSDSALRYRNGVEYQPSEASIDNVVVVDELDTNLRLQIALQAARDADRLYGLCTPASARAWKMVDDIYSLSSASREVENNVKRVFGEEKSIWSAFQQ